MVEAVSRHQEVAIADHASEPVPSARGWVVPGLVALGAMTAWWALYEIARRWGLDLIASGVRLQLGDAPPLVGSERVVEWSARVAPALFLGGSVVLAGSQLARRATWRAVLGGSAVIAGAWAVAVALVDPRGDALTAPLRTHQYLETAATISSPLSFVSSFADRIASYNIHTQGHPPGFVLLLWALDRTGLGGAGWEALLCIGGGAIAVPAALVALREVAGEVAARRAAPFLTIAPVAVFVATTGDGFFAGVSAWAVALVVVATGRRGRRGDAYAIGGGFLFGVSVFLSYGLVLVAVIPFAVAVSRRSVRPLVLAALGAMPVFLAFLAAGFWWVDGLRATQTRYYAGVAQRRPYDYFLVANLAAFALALGPAAAVALAWLRDSRIWLLVGAALAIAALADVSGMSKAEVERIWIPFTPWVLLATATFGVRKLRREGAVVSALLASQVMATLWLQLAWGMPW